MAIRPSLIDRLRDVEAALLRISDFELPVEFAATTKIYEQRLDQLEHAHSRSWFGEHSNTYVEAFRNPPGGGSFDVEWGFIPGYQGSRNKGWRIYSRGEVKDFILDGFGDGVFHAWHSLQERVTTEYSTARDQAIDVLEAISAKTNIKALTRYAVRIEAELAPYTLGDYINGRLASTPRMTRDSEEIAKGQIVPLQVQYLASIQTAETNKKRARELSTVVRNIIEAISLNEPIGPTLNMETRIFIGHGRSDQWIIVRDFVRDRLRLEFDEFNRVPVAGISNKERLSDMLDQCSFALLVMTAEDEHEDGSLHARENVIHEIGLFQGRLGWRKAIVLIEEGCQEFSNIVGLGQVRYRRDNIGDCFEEIRRILEREELISTSG